MMKKFILDYVLRVFYVLRIYQILISFKRFDKNDCSSFVVVILDFGLFGSLFLLLFIFHQTLPFRFTSYFRNHMLSLTARNRYRDPFTMVLSILILGFLKRRICLMGLLV